MENLDSAPGVRTSRRRRTRHAALRVAAIYAVLGVAWILFSDLLVTALTHDPDTVRRLSIAKGWGYVVFTALLLFLLVRRELHARQEMESELIESHETLSALINSSPLPIFTLDREGRVDLWNPAAERILGWTAEEVRGQSLPTVPPECREESAGLRRRAMGGETFQATVRRLHRDGSEAIYELWCAPVHSPDGDVKRIMSILNDVTDRHRAEDALRQSEERFRTLFEGSPFGISISHGTEITYVNPTLVAMFGYDSPADFVGRSLLDFCAPHERERVAEAVLRRQRGEFFESAHERWGLRRDGSEFPYHVHIVRIEMPGGGAQVGFFTDLTAQHEAAKALQASEEKLLQAQKMEAIGRLAGGLAHDLNNLLTAIIGFSDLILDELPPGSPMRASGLEIVKAADRAAGLTRQLLAFSRKQVLQPRTFDLNAVLRSLTPMLERLIGKDIRVLSSLEPDLWTVHADPSQIEQVVMNLAINARDAMPGGGTLRIETSNVGGNDGDPSRPGDGQVRLRVSDTGHGMPPEVQEHLFEPYFTTKESGKGTGLGLSTVYGIVTQSGGQITVESAPGAGSCFDILLPASPSPRCTVTAEPDSRAKLGGAETILVVEDEPAVRQLMQDVLAARGFSVLVARDADDALAICSSHPGVIDLLLSDLVMPGKGGRQLAKDLAECRPEMRVLFVSGYSDDVLTDEDGLRPGTGFLGKPFTPSSLVRKVRETIESGRS